VSEQESPPVVSCIVPTFNSERYVGKALESILAQTYRPIDIIVADDGSTDGTVEVVRAYGECVVIVSQHTAGPAATRNLGLSAAGGDFVAFLDADDLWNPEKLERQMARFRVQPALDLCVTAAQYFWTEDMEGEGQQYRDHPRAQPVPGYATTTLLARRAIFERVGHFNADLWFADATEWFARAAERGAVIEMLPEVLTYHRMHRDNLTRRRLEASKREFLQVVRASLQRRRADGAAIDLRLTFPGLQ
jgi:glycosyltransferase involved in cell wall biosynthesis